MEKKNLIYIVGGVAVIGLVYYLYNKNKQPRNVDARLGGGQPPQGGGAPPTGAGEKGEEAETSGSSAPAPAPAKSLSKKEARKQRRADSKTYMASCGKKPVLKKNRPAWQQCVDEQKAKGSAFDGATNYFEITSSMSGQITDNMDIF
jgi:hypothetical protein